MYCKGNNNKDYFAGINASLRGGFCAWSVEIGVFPRPTGCMLTSFGLLYEIDEYSVKCSEWVVYFPEVLNSTVSSVTNGRFLPFLE